MRREDGKARIDPVLCTGCGECVQICPYGAFEPATKVSSEWVRVLRTARPR